MCTQGHVTYRILVNICLLVICLTAYVNKYNRVTNENNNRTEVQTSKRGTFNLYVQFLKSVFDSGATISFSEIRNMINDKHKINIV